jgi:hypothetical protein
LLGSAPKISSGNSMVLPVLAPCIFKISTCMIIQINVVSETQTCVTYFCIKTIEPL